MARPMLVLEEVIGMLETVGAPAALIEKFREQAEFVLNHKPQQENDHVAISSGFGQKSQRGFVTLAVSGVATQMDTQKAQEIGLMLLQAAEAAQSDEVFLLMLKELGIEAAQAQGHLLLKLREIRQGTRGTSYPS